ncbi:hypothetical protein PDJAM_G00198490 [Pangasius djambal]|uniref:Uncharacterized protein n=1 Tax=Pangasius djambal TaxID=1691987 RepID=A0ACC5Y6U7_9TELE|nr:hypothetical protein [Pangasius djambal]
MYFTVNNELLPFTALFLQVKVCCLLGHAHSAALAANQISPPLCTHFLLLVAQGASGRKATAVQTAESGVCCLPARLQDIGAVRSK